jgi:hypothetical protein
MSEQAFRRAAGVLSAVLALMVVGGFWWALAG